LRLYTGRAPHTSARLDRLDLLDNQHDHAIRPVVLAAPVNGRADSVLADSPRGHGRQLRAQYQHLRKARK
jgi:hypothetical protein